MKPLGVTAETRLPALPNVPTFAESGITGFDVKALRGILAPRGTPRPVVNRLSAELGKILAMPDIKEKMSVHGMTPYFSTPEAFQSRMQSDLVKYAQALKTVNVAGER